MNIAIIALIIFVFGTLIGSFLSVIVNRIIKNEKGILFGRSKCPKCKKTLKAWQLIPILSYLSTGGKCAFCGKKISKEYPLIELATGLLMAFTYLYFTSSAVAVPPLLGFLLPTLQTQSWLFYLELIAVILLTVTYFDLKIMAAPNFLLWIWLIVCAFSISPTRDFIYSHVISLAIVLIFFGSQILFSRGKWLGSGDLFFSLGVAFLFGWELTLVFLVIAYLIGGVIAAILLAGKKFNRKSTFPFLPFLALATFLTIYFGTSLLNWYLNFSFFPF